MALTVHDVQVDVAAEHHDEAVEWWAAALGAKQSSDVPGPFTHLDGARSRVGVHLQRIAEGPGGFHLDLAAGSAVDAEVDRLVDLGAEVVSRDAAWTVMRDPAALRFCVVRGRTADDRLSDDRDGLHLRVLMIDVPSDAAAGVAAFWAAALGGEVHRVGERFPAFSYVRPALGQGGPVNLFVQATDTGPARMHVDLHCADVAGRDREVERLVRLGAVEVARREHWVVLRPPGGQLVCVVPDEHP